MGKKLFGGSGKGRFAEKNASAELREPAAEQKETAETQHREDAAQPAPRKERKEKRQKREKKPGRGMKVLAVLLALLLLIEGAYCVVIFTDLIPPIAKLRSIYIETAMTTMTHQWLATGLIPGDIVQEVVDRMAQAQANQVGVNSGWDDVTEATEPPKSPSSGFSKDAAASMLGLLAQDLGLNSGEDDFFELFHELDEESTRAYVEKHPETIAAGWDKLLINEAGLDDNGTDIMTKQGDQVLAIDAANGLLVIRVKGSTYRGALILGKDPSRLKCAPSESRNVGQRVGEIAEAHGALAGITGSGFEDLPGQAEGSHQTGAAMCSGDIRGNHNSDGKRIELHRDNRLYVMDAYMSFSEDCTDATEWMPALIVDGVNVAGQDYTYTALNPRAALGQTRDESIMFLAIEGRKVDSIGCNAEECADILMRYDGYQAMNLDGGTSAMLWYQGEPIIRCSNSAIPEGRRLPNAWVYCAEPVPDAE